jgi:tellurite resistance protein TehA-like permease
LLAEVWKLLQQKRFSGYDMARWSMVFPIWMYSAATHELRIAINLAWLDLVALAIFWTALGTWLFGVAALSITQVRRLRRARSA